MTINMTTTMEKQMKEMYKNVLVLSTNEDVEIIANSLFNYTSEKLETLKWSTNSLTEIDEVIQI